MTHDGFELAGFLPYRLAVLSERVSRRLAADYEATHGISMAEWRVLVHLRRAGRVSVRDIVRFVNMEKPRVSRAVSRLAEAGLVAKAQAQGDGRLVEIALTPAGGAVLDQILTTARAVEARLLAALAPGDRAALARIEAALHTAMDADPKARPRVTGEGEGAR